MYYSITVLTGVKGMITKKELGKRIKKFREDFDLSQEELAARLSLPRPSISQIESGQREVSSIEVAKLSKIFGVSIDDLLSRDLEKKCRAPRKQFNKPKFNKRKFKQVLLYILEKCGAKPNVGETILFKLLYFVDFDYYELYEDFLTGEAYRRISYGPAPCNFNIIVSEMIEKGQVKKIRTEYFGMPQKKYIPLVKPDLKMLDGREMKVIEEVIERLSSMTASAIENYSHQDIPWEVTKDKKIIDYDTVFYRRPAYSVRTYPEE